MRFFITCLFLVATLLIYNVGVAQEETDKADAVIDACITANGGYAYLDSLFQHMVTKSSNTRSQSNNPHDRKWLIVPEAYLLEHYKSRSGESRIIRNKLPKGIVELSATNSYYYWNIEDDQVKLIDTAHMFRGLWEYNDMARCIELPLNLHKSCRKYPLVWGGQENENGRTYDVLTGSGPYGGQYWIDQQTHLPYKYVLGNGQYHNYYEDYRQVGKLWVAFKHRKITKEGRQVSEQIIQSVAFPRQLPDSLFFLPEQFSHLEPEGPDTYK